MESVQKVISARFIEVRLKIISRNAKDETEFAQICVNKKIYSQIALRQISFNHFGFGADRSISFDLRFLLHPPRCDQ